MSASTIASSPAHGGATIPHGRAAWNRARDVSYTLARGLSYAEARDMCEDWNATHKPGRLSRKAEFTSD